MSASFVVAITRCDLLFVTFRSTHGSEFRIATHTHLRLFCDGPRRKIFSCDWLPLLLDRSFILSPALMSFLSIKWKAFVWSPSEGASTQSPPLSQRLVLKSKSRYRNKESSKDWRENNFHFCTQLLRRMFCYGFVFLFRSLPGKPSHPWWERWYRRCTCGSISALLRTKRTLGLPRTAHVDAAAKVTS